MERRQRPAGLVAACVIAVVAGMPRGAAFLGPLPCPTTWVPTQRSTARSAGGACVLRSKVGPEDAPQRRAEGFVWRKAPAAVPRIVRVDKIQQTVSRAKPQRCVCAVFGDNSMLGVLTLRTLLAVGVGVCQGKKYQVGQKFARPPAPPRAAVQPESSPVEVSVCVCVQRTAPCAGAKQTSLGKSAHALVQGCMRWGMQ
jgi:hypothetical protein